MAFFYSLFLLAGCGFFYEFLLWPVAAQHAWGKETGCYVNPMTPSEAVLNRDIPANIGFGIIPFPFIFVGAAGVLWAAFGGRNTNHLNLDADEPWLRRSDWASKRILSSNKKGLVLLWCFVGLWSLITMPAMWLLLKPEELRNGSYGSLVVLFFPLFGLVLLFLAIVQTRLWLRFGESVFEMAFVPGQIGGMLEGTIRLRCSITPRDSVIVRLICLKRIEGHGEGSTSERTLWQAEDSVNIDTGDAIPISFHIPKDCSATTIIDRGDGIFWNLEVKAKLSSGSYFASFDVPIFRGK